MSRTKALLSLTFASIIVGSTLIVCRMISTSPSIYSIQFFSMLIACIILYYLRGKENLQMDLLKLRKSDFLIFFYQTLSGVVIFRIFIVYGVQLTLTIDAGIILSLTPITTVLLSVYFLKEKMGVKEGLAMTFAFCGVLAININGAHQSFSENNLRFLGNLLILLAVLGESAFVIFSKKVTTHISPLTRSMLVCLFAVGMFLPFSFFELIQNPKFLADIHFWMLTFYYGVILTVLAYVLWFQGIVHVNGTTAGIFNTLIPVSSITLVFLFFGETINMLQLVGLICILLGVLLVAFKKVTID